jgi:hypothetical protein
MLHPAGDTIVSFGGCATEKSARRFFRRDLKAR